MVGLLCLTPEDDASSIFLVIIMQRKYFSIKIDFILSQSKQPVPITYSCTLFQNKFKHDRKVH